MRERLVDNPLVLIIATRESHGNIPPLLRLLVQMIHPIRRDSNTDNLIESSSGVASHHGLKLSVETTQKAVLPISINTNMLLGILR